MKAKKTMVVTFLAPAIVTYLLVYVYPSIRSIIMSFFYMKNVTSSISTWQFVGIQNYSVILNSKMFMQSLHNIFYIWLFGGIGVFIAAMVYSVILTSGIKGKSFFRAVLYLPNVITAIALATMWIHFAFNNKYGLFHAMFNAIGLKSLADFQWTSPDHQLFSMTIAYSFGAVGYYVLIFMAGIEKIPADFYEAATIEGADIYKKFTKITMPLMQGVIKTGIVIWSISAIAFFIWSMMFSPMDPEVGTITPMVYMYNLIFGRSLIVTNPELINAGAGAAVGVFMTILVLIIFTAVNYLLPEKDRLEY